MLTMRTVDKNGFGNKEREWNKKDMLLKWREKWADVCNEMLREKGFDERIDHRTLKAQGIDREPTIHVGVKSKAMERKGIINERVRRNNEIIARNKARCFENTAKRIHDLKSEFIVLEKEISSLRQEMTNVEQEMRIFKRKTEDIIERAIQIQTLKGERTQEQARNHYIKTYQITPEQAPDEAQRIEIKTQIKTNLRDKLYNKLASFIEERDGLMIEYQRTKASAENAENWNKIQERITELDKTHNNQFKSTKERLVWERTVRILDEQRERERIRGDYRAR
jgi:hypothetical protein